METNKVNTGNKRVSLSSGTFRIFAKSVRDVASNKLKKDRSGSTSTTSSSNECSPNKDGDSPFSDGKKTPGRKMSNESVLETPEKRKTPESLSPSKSHSKAKINRVDSPEKPLKSRRSIAIEIENLKENSPAPDLEDKEPTSKNGGNEKNGMVDELTTQNNEGKPESGTAIDVKNDEPKTTKVDEEDTKSKKNPPDKLHSEQKSLVPYNRQRRSSNSDSSNQYQQQHHKTNRYQNPGHNQPHRHDSRHDIDPRTQGRFYQRYDNEWSHRPPKRNPPTRFRAESPNRNQLPRFRAVSPNRNAPTRYRAESPNRNQPPRFRAVSPNRNQPPRLRAESPNRNAFTRYRAESPNRNQPPRFRAVSPNRNQPPRFRAVSPNRNQPPRFRAVSPNRNQPPRFRAVSPNRNQPPRFRAVSPNRNQPPRFIAERSSGAQEDWSNDLLDVKEKLDDHKLTKGLSTSLPNEETSEASSTALNSSCPELDQDNKVPISRSDIDISQEIVSADLQEKTNCYLGAIQSKYYGRPHFEPDKDESENDFNHGHKLAGPETNNKSKELFDIIDRSALDTNETAKNLVKNDTKDDSEDPQADVKTPVHTDFMSQDSGVNTPDAVGSTIVPATPENKILEDGLKVEIPQMSKKIDADDNTEDWSDELSEVLTPGIVVTEVQEGMTSIQDHHHSLSDKNNDLTQCSDTGNVFESDLQGSSNSKLELNWAEGWTNSNVETSSADVTGISIEGVIQDTSNSTDAGEKAALLLETCMSDNLEKSVPSTENQAVGLRYVENKDCNSNTEDLVPKTNSNQPIVSLQDGVPRMKAIFARGGIRPSHSSRAAHSYIYTERSTIASDDKDIIKPHPLMSVQLEGTWEKVLENDAEEEPDEEEIFDSEVKTPQNVDQPLPVTETSKDPNNNIEGSTGIVPGNVAPQYSQDIRRKASVKEDQKPIDTIQNQSVQPSNVSILSPLDRSRDNSETVKYSRPHVPRRNTQTPPMRTQNNESVEAEMKKIDDYLGLTKHQKRPEHHASSHKRNIRPRTHSFSESFGKSEKKGFKTEKSFRSDKSNKSEDWSSELLDVQSTPVERHHFTEKLNDGSANSFQNVSNYSNKSDTIPIPDNSLMDINANYSPNRSVENHGNRNSPERSFQKHHPTETKGKFKGTNPGSNQIEISRCNHDSINFVVPNVKNDSIQSAKEYSMERDISGDKHGFLTSSKMSISNNGVAISDAFSDFSSVGSDDEVLKQTDSITDPKKKSDSSISMRRKHHYRYSSQDMSISETISSMSTDQRCQKAQKAEINDVDYRHKPPMPPNPLNPLEYPYYHPGKSPPGPPFDPRLFNPYIPFYPPYMYPPYYPGYDNSLLEQHQKIKEERRHIKQEKEDPIKPRKDQVYDNQSVKKEGEDADHQGQVPNLSHLITVPLNKITDLEQAHLLLQFVDQLVRKVPHASGAYYRAVSNQGEPSLEVGATTAPSPQNKNKTKSPVKYRLPSSHQHERRPSASNDGLSLKPQSQYQPRYPSPQFNPMEDPQCPHQDLPSQILEYPDIALKTAEDNRYHDFRNYYLNQNRSNMDNLREPESPNPSLVSYDITDDDDYYEETGKNVRKVIGPRDPLNDRRNIICNKLIEESVGQKPLELYHQEFPELVKSQKGPKRSVSDTDASIRTVIERDMSAKETFEQKQTNIRYVPPHKRRFSEYGDSRPMTKFGALNTFEEENRNPYEVWQKYLKSSPTDPDKNSAPATTNYLKNNWREKTDPEESYPAKFSNVPPPYVQENQKCKRRYSSGQIPESLVNDAKLYRDPYRPHSDSRQFESSTPASSMDSISSRSSYTSRLLNDNRLNNDATPSPSFNQMWKIRFKDRSKMYQVPFIDSHCHIDLLYERLNYNGTYKEFLQQHSDCYPSNYAGCIAIFCYPRNFKLDGLWKKLAEEDNVWISIGCHPKNAKQYNELVEDNMLKILKHPKVVAVGEIGLDYSGNHGQLESLQKSVLRRQLKIGLEVKKPIVIHCREAEDDCLQILEEIIPRNYKIQCHCFSGNYSQAKRWLSAFPNLYLGLTPVVTFSGAHAAHDVARNIPLNRLLLETDSPYFVPRPLIKEEQVISFPGFALTVAEDVAYRRGISVEEVLRHCRDNMTSLFGI